MTSAFTFGADEIALPQGAWAGTHRRTLRHRGRPVLALTQGRRAYVYPLFTPAGFAVTSESPGDHPHHNSFWVAADHVHCRMPTATGYEDYTYNFYVNDTFQGRAPGRIVEVGCVAEPDGVDAYRLIQTLEWRGPNEWAAPDGRLAARETRTLRVAATPGMYAIDVDSQLAAAEWDFTIGPTRHAYFNLRVADSMIVAFGGIVRDDRGMRGCEAISGTGARWIDFSGPVGGGHVAGLALLPDPRDHAELSWFVTDWGVITVGPCRQTGRLIRRGEEFRARYRVLVHDGDAEVAGIARLFDQTR
jgi:hypothetical protein